MQRARRRSRAAPSARGDRRRDCRTAGMRRTFHLPQQELNKRSAANTKRLQFKFPAEVQVRKQITRPRMSCPNEPGEKKTGKHTRATLRPHSKISNQ
eukprot:6181564-Prymnesium_polylepis.1